MGHPRADTGLIDAYIAGFPEDVQAILKRVREAIHAAIPDGEERIRYGMPAVMLDDRYAIHFAGWKKHIGMYPISRFEGDLEARIAPYRAKKDSVNFPYKEEIPYALITEVTAELHRRRTSG